MSNDIQLETFPSSHETALALLYVQSRDLSDKTPSEIHKMYVDALKEIKQNAKQLHENSHSLR